MLTYIGRRCLYMVPTLFAISVVAFAIIQLPPGDFLTSWVTRMESEGEKVDPAMLEGLRERYALGDPFYVQYGKWISGILFHGDFGESFEFGRSVTSLVLDRLPWSIGLTVFALIFTWVVAFPIGLYSAVRQYSIGDYLATTIGFLGLAIPNFMLALAMMYIAYRVFGLSTSGISPLTIGIAIVVLGTAGTAGTIRILRANLLDELKKPYVVAARARGVSERALVVKYPVRMALNPFVSTIGWVLPGLVGGEVIVAQVLNLPTTGPLLFSALRTQDMYLAGSIILIISVLTVIGTLLSDILLAWLDPRVRLGYR
ncbi:ABC transporter permease [Phytoactinopolyspora halotolerans]|uniref:ABC transporter permease n=1 Tax=Phytoactinopolyspora halotolerans TaxID=1981512 RepID=A0A6L9SAQ0_9ACTN|nr:ABC transporter permease [Phytoactinopolyspora halotolerans]NEE01652.1 ABC transporter permease [Phytoactinopolyspora halotolerans]